MADKITNESLIKTTQIQQKTAEGMIAIRPETQTDIVLNTSTNAIKITRININSTIPIPSSS